MWKGTSVDAKLAGKLITSVENHSHCWRVLRCCNHNYLLKRWCLHRMHPSSLLPFMQKIDSARGELQALFSLCSIHYFSSYLQCFTAFVLVLHAVLLLLCDLHLDFLVTLFNLMLFVFLRALPPCYWCCINAVYYCVLYYISRRVEPLLISSNFKSDPFFSLKLTTMPVSALHAAVRSWSKSGQWLRPHPASLHQSSLRPFEWKHFHSSSAQI